MFRRKFLEPHTIGIVPHGSYRCSDKHSVVAIKWLEWLQESEKIKIRHARNGGEVRVGPFKVDGQLRSDPMTVFEFYGCVSYQVYILKNMG